MVAADDNRSFQFAAADHLVEAQADLGPLTVAQPADAGRQPLELHALAGQVNPAGQRLIVREGFEHRLIGAVNVLRIAGEGGPTKRAFALAEERADVLGNEPGDSERILNPGLDSLRANVVAVFERDRAV